MRTIERDKGLDRLRVGFYNGDEASQTVDSLLPDF
jgi:hypothetical protein